MIYPTGFPERIFQNQLELQEQQPITTPPSSEILARKIEQYAAPEKILFQPFTIKIAKKDFVLTSLDEMRQKVAEVVQEVSDNHIKISIHVPLVDPERTQAMQFVGELGANVEVMTTRWKDLIEIVPKKAEEAGENLTIRHYKNGVVEEVLSSGDSGWEDWEGRRVYPNGTIETGIFERFRLHKGNRVEKEMTTYRLPNTLVQSLDRSLMYAEKSGEKRLIILQKQPGDDFDYVQIDEDLIPTLANILKEYSNISRKNLETIFSESINCEEFLKVLFEKNDIFSLKTYSLQILLEIIHKKGLVVDLNQAHSITKKTLLDHFIGNEKILKTLLSIDPHLIQRIEGKESAPIRALLSGNEEGAFILFSAMEKQQIPLLPREILFKKVAFAEGEVTPEELKGLPREDLEIVYRLANMHSQLNLVKILRTLGFGRSEDLLMSEGPSIFGCNMDALEMHDCLYDFLTNLLSQKLLLTKSEFNQLPEGSYTVKGKDIGRILGRDYIERKAQELGLKYVKVPKKMLVIDDDTELRLCIDDLNIKSLSNNVSVCAQRIREANRKISPEETSELLRLFEATGFTDIHWGNVIIAADGVYIIDTEFSNFWVASHYFINGHQYAEMATIVHALPKAQQQEFVDELNAKVETYQRNEDAINKQKNLRLRAELAALKKTGCFYGPSFTFSLRELSSERKL